MPLLFILLIFSSHFTEAAEPICLTEEQLQSSDLGRDCQIQLCSEPVEIPSTVEDLSQLRKTFDLKSFDSSKTPYLKSSRDLVNKLNKMSGPQMVEDILNSPDKEAQLLKTLAAGLIKQNEDGSFTVSDQTVMPQADLQTLAKPLTTFVIVSEAPKRFAENFKPSEYSSGPGWGGAMGEISGSFETSTAPGIVLLREFLASYSPESGVTKAEFEEMRDWIMKGKKNLSKKDQKRFNDFTLKIATYPIRSHRKLFERLCQELIDSLKLTVDVLTKQSSIACNIRDYYAQRSRQLQKSGTIEKWTKEVEAGIVASLVPSLPKAVREKVSNLSSLCRIRLEKPETQVPKSDLQGISEDILAVVNEIQTCGVSFSDKAELKSDRSDVIISGATVVYGGKQVLAHEVGHCLRKKLQASTDQELQLRLRKLDECLISNHDGKKHTLEEDFADWFSATVSESSQNVGCLISDVMKSKPSLENNIKEPHSTDLFRSIHIQTVQNKPLPKSCKDLMIQENKEIRRCGL